MRFLALLCLLVLPVPLHAAELLMVERHGCAWCDRWNAEIAPIYPKTEQGARAPLRRAQINALPDDVILGSRPIFTPTFILIDNGRELGRIEGYGGDEFFWFLLTNLLDAHPDATALP
ncbi:hypothetical protein [Roseovarius autotrophicus]|uniref:hypothetical protein n=1 Tax=Roseovarius autotrophicus TaxID=2824121 RepID=UPI0019E6C297|nr:hypothetical protein [Roseovarius autotrophicus]MBE0453117.1 hypothetical protein [Roseovarius sp.]